MQQQPLSQLPLFKSVTLPHEFDFWGDRARHSRELQDKYDRWADAIKERAVTNLSNDYERLRIQWQTQFNRPRYDHFLDYTDEELIQEAWEIYFYNHPDDIRTKNVKKRYNKETGAVYYQVGDEIIDQLEEAFSRGDTPDLDAAFSFVEDGPSIWSMPWFDGAPAEIMGDESDEIKIDFAGEDWLKQGIDDDPVLRAMAAKLGVEAKANG